MFFSLGLISTLIILVIFLFTLKGINLVFLSFLSPSNVLCLVIIGVIFIAFSIYLYFRKNNRTELYNANENRWKEVEIDLQKNMTILKGYQNTSISGKIAGKIYGDIDRIEQGNINGKINGNLVGSFNGTIGGKHVIIALGINRVVNNEDVDVDGWIFQGGAYGMQDVQINAWITGGNINGNVDLILC